MADPGALTDDDRVAHIKGVMECAMLVCKSDCGAVIGGLLGALLVIVGTSPDRATVLDTILAELHGVQAYWQSTAGKAAAASKASVPS